MWNADAIGGSAPSGRPKQLSAAGAESLEWEREKEGGMKAAGERPERAELELDAGGEVTWRDGKKRGEMKVGEVPQGVETRCVRRSLGYKVKAPRGL